MCPISPVMWNSGATPKIVAAGADPHPVPVDLRGEDHVAVGVHRALGHTGRARGVGQEGDVVRRERHRRRDLPAVLRDELGEVGRALGALLGHPLEQPLVVPALVLELAGGEHELDVGVGHHLAADLLVQRLERDQHLGAGVLEQVAQLADPAHRVDRDHHPAGLPGADHRDDELRDVLQVDREPVAALEAVRQQPARERVALLVELGPADHAVEVGQRGPGGVGLQPGLEHLEGVRELDLVVVRLVAVQGQPGPVVVVAHGASYLMTTGLTGEPLPFATLSGAATYRNA